MAGLETSIVVGIVGTNDGLKTAGRQNVCNLSIAVDSPKKNDKPIWYRVVCWGKNAEVAAQYARKGKEVGVVGHVHERTYRKRDGTEGKTMEITAEMLFLGGFQVFVAKGVVGNNKGLERRSGGTQICRLRLAVDGRKKGDQTEWFTVTAFNGLAEIAAKYMPKGREITVVGRVSNRAYERDDGTTGFSTEILADHITLGRKPKGSSSGQAAPPRQAPPPRASSGRAPARAERAPVVEQSPPSEEFGIDDILDF